MGLWRFKTATWSEWTMYSRRQRHNNGSAVSIARPRSGTVLTYTRTTPLSHTFRVQDRLPFWAAGIQLVLSVHSHLTTLPGGTAEHARRNFLTKQLPIAIIQHLKNEFASSVILKSKAVVIGLYSQISWLWCSAGAVLDCCAEMRTQPSSLTCWYSLSPFRTGSPHPSLSLLIFLPLSHFSPSCSLLIPLSSLPLSICLSLLHLPFLFPSFIYSSLSLLIFIHPSLLFFSQSISPFSFSLVLILCLPSSLSSPLFLFLPFFSIHSVLTFSALRCAVLRHIVMSAVMSQGQSHTQELPVLFSGHTSDSSYLHQEKTQICTDTLKVKSFTIIKAGGKSPSQKSACC